MILICDLVFICLTSLIAYVSYERLFDGTLNTVVDFTILVIYVFMCFPIILNYLVGIPEYNTAYWYAVFIPAMKNETVVFIYDTYVSLVLICLYFYGSSKKIGPQDSTNLAKRPERGSVKYAAIVVVVLLPFLVVLISDDLPKYAIYADSSARGLDESFVFLINTLILLSLLYFSYLYFTRESRNKKDLAILVIYSFALAWVSGKRYIVALMLVMYLFFFLSCEKNDEKRLKSKRAIPILLLLLVVFSGIYMAVIKPLTNTIDYDLYEMFRVDFGRDDVTKYVIYKTFVLNQPILEYPGQSIISYILFFIPRSLWPTKPWQHYQYLTSSILGVPISQIPAGTTPSGFEMFFANFGIAGIPLFVIVILAIVKFFDGAYMGLMSRGIGVVLIMVFLTQSIDVYLIYVLLLVFLLILSCIQKRPRNTNRLS